jgi:hypothetical protein
MAIFIVGRWWCTLARRIFGLQVKQATPLPVKFQPAAAAAAEAGDENSDRLLQLTVVI